MSMNLKNFISCPFLCAMPETTTLAEAPIMVPFPPRHAPSESPHHSGRTAASPPNAGAMSFIKGIMVATNGMLSTMDDAMAEPQSITYPVVAMSPPVTSSIMSASLFIYSKKRSRPEKGYCGRLEMELPREHETAYDAGKYDEALLEERDVCEGLPFLELHYPLLLFIRYREGLCVHELEGYERREHYYGYYRADAEYEVHEGKSGRAAYHDVRRVAYKGRGSADIGHDYL